MICRDFLLIELDIAKTLLRTQAAGTDPSVVRRRVEIARTALEAVDRFLPRPRLPATELQTIRSRYAELPALLRSFTEV